MPYTVHQLAKLAGVTPRTLRFYDKQGLLSPATHGRNGYRYYGEKELVRLQQILFFRELDFPLEDIKRMMDRPGFDVVEALRDQKKLMLLKRARIDGLLNSLDKTIMSITDDKKMSGEELYDAFKDDDVKQYQEEVKERWGDTDAYKQSMAKVGKMTRAEMDMLKADGEAFTRTLAEAMGKDVRSDEVQALVAQHQAGINFFYECGTKTYRGLGQMYVDDPRFTAYYDKFRPGLAAWLRDAIVVYCDRKEAKERETAA